MSMEPVEVEPLDPGRYLPLMEDADRERWKRDVESATAALSGRRIWNVNSTARGGGVAEMLRPLVAYARGAGVACDWAVIPGNERFFEITKRIHNHLHGEEGDGGPLGDAERRDYEAALAAAARDLLEMVRPGDVVMLHDPQTAGLVPAVSAHGCPVVWRCHVGVDFPNDLARSAWRFLLPWVSRADECVFSRRAFEWDGLDERRLSVVPPTIDAFSPKNADLTEEQVTAILGVAGLGPRTGARASFPPADGGPDEVTRQARVTETAPLQGGERLVVQVSRWDRLKDPEGVLRGFARLDGGFDDVHLILAGPDVEAVSDDPEGREVLHDVEHIWQRLAEPVRARVHLASLPMASSEENAAIVNALQRRAAVVVQKSLAEGFGLTVSEAMWKRRPVVASRIGGIQDQVKNPTTGLLLDDPQDLDGFAAALRRLLGNPDEAQAMGDAGHERVRRNYLAISSLMRYAELFTRLVKDRSPA